MEQRAFTIVTPIHPDRIEQLKKYLEPVGADIKNNRVIDFCVYDRLHYCCFVIVEDRKEIKSPPLLVFEGNIDGGVEDFLDTMLQKNAEFLRKVYECCENSPGQNAPADDFKVYLLNYERGFNAYFVGKPGRTLAEIKREKNLREKIETYLDENHSTLKEQQPAMVREAIQKYVQSDPELAWTQQIPAPPNHIRYGKWILGGVTTAILLGLFGSVSTIITLLGGAGMIWAIPVLLAIFALLTAYLRYKESTDNEVPLDLPGDRVLQVQKREDRQLQNHLTHVTYVKPGLFRHLTLRVVLFAINLIARYAATEGELGGIATIHFARWVIVEGRPRGSKRVVFLSNYDGSWENYLGEFVDHASSGLTAVWSNTELEEGWGFPKARWLFLQGGSRDEQRFKLWARNSQYSELVWYSAYPDLSVKNISNNQAILEQLHDPGADPAAWLRRF